MMLTSVFELKRKFIPDLICYEHIIVEFKPLAQILSGSYNAVMPDFR